MKRIIFLDVETTGLDINKDRIIEIGCIEYIDGNLTGRIFHSYFNPETEIDKNAFKIHGINNNFLKFKPKFYEKFIEFISFVKNTIVIAHNAKFDQNFIDKEIKNIDINLKLNYYCEILDSLSLFRKLFPRKSNKLIDLCERYKIKVQKKRKHGALSDAFLLYLVIIKMGILKNKLNYEYY